MKVGILGSGQLGMMLAEAGREINVDCLCYGPDPNPCAARASDVIIGGFDDQDKIHQLLERVDIITVESEHIPLSLLETLEKQTALYPSARAVGISQDRLKEKIFLESLDIPLPAYTAIDDVTTLRTMMHDRPGIYIVKTRLQGYDGKGQAELSEIAHSEAVMEELGGKNLVAEQKVNFDREVSIISVRGRDGDMCHYPLNENVHRSGILRSTRMIDEPALQKQAQSISERIMSELNYVGVLCVEYFDVGGQLLVNEVAPRVHNSGHITIEAANTSQFENHLRAITGLPLRDCGKCLDCAMLNIIGEEPDRSHINIESSYFYHAYHKQARPGRKLGHITVCDEDETRLTNSVTQLDNLLS